MAVTEPAQPAAHDGPTGDAPTSLGPERAADDGPVTLPEPGYELGEMIGSGGMGEVLAAQDLRIGREVAIKRMRSERPDGSKIARFLREARIQARLDHPAIVPVHELGIDEHGRPFFTMKRLSGVTFAARLADGSPQNRLLRAFVDVCNAVEFAHARGVVHRDLKPSNIMLGDFGEVYVLDWGVARVLTEVDHVAGTGVDSVAEGTQTGTMLGTPGYMAPEQIQGAQVTTAADVYALGAMLFEILVREPLHPRGISALAHTLTEPQQLPSHRRQDLVIPPELDATCGDALAADPAQRPTVRALADRVQAYLDGDRDLAHRRALAATQLADAWSALDAGDRTRAMRSAGRALALDPESAAAVELVGKLLVEPPAILPQELDAQLEAVEQQGTRGRVTNAMVAWGSPFALFPVLPLLQVKSWSWLVAFYVALTVTGVTAFLMAWRRGRTSVPFLMISSLVVVVLWSRLAGPLMLTPVLICGILLSFAPHPKLRPRPRLVLGFGLVALVLPLALELAGAIPSTVQTTARGLLVTSTIFESTPHAHVILVLANTLFVLVVGFFAVKVAATAMAANRQLQIQAWHLQQLLPTRAAG